LLVTFFIGAAAIISAGAHAADYDQITVSAPKVKTVGRDTATGAPIEETTVTTKVQYDPVTLTTNSGVTLLNDSVLDAARKACNSADPLRDDGDDMCVSTAVESAKPQIDAAIARARATAKN
jgi:UrcA family protein